MSHTLEVLEQYAEFIAEKYRRELRGECKENEPRILDLISPETLEQIYKYGECPAWSRYVIDLNGTIDPATFAHENSRYRHTPRIFKACTVFGIEKLYRTRPFTDEYRDAVKQAVAFAAEQGIAIVYQNTNPADSVYLIQEQEQVKIKFAYFRLQTEGSLGNG